MLEICQSMSGKLCENRFASIVIRLQQLVEPKTEPVESPKVVQPSSASILRPAQLVLKTATNPVPRVPSLPKEPTKLPKVRNPPPAKYNDIISLKTIPLSDV